MSFDSDRVCLQNYCADFNSFSWKAVSITADYTATDQAIIIEANVVLSPINITLSNIPRYPNQVVFVRRKDDTSTGNTVTILPSPGYTILQGASYTLTRQNQILHIYRNPTSLDWTTLTNRITQISPGTTKGDLLVYNGTEYVAQATGANGSILLSDNTTSTGVRWGSLPSPQNTLVVRKNPLPGEFASLAAALASIPTVGPGTPTDTNRYAIHVYPGDYAEPQINMKSYVFVVGEDMRAVRFNPNAMGFPFFVMAPLSGFAFCTIHDTDPLYPAVLFSNTGAYTLLHKVELQDCARSLRVESLPGDTEQSLVYLEYCDTDTSSSLVYSLSVDDAGSTYGNQVSAENFFTYGAVSTSDVVVNGPQSQVIIQAAVTQGNGTGTFATITNGSRIDCRSLWISGRTTGFIVPADAGTPTVLCAGVLFDNLTTNYNITNVNTVGHNDGYSEYSKTIIPKPAPFFIASKNQQIITVASKGADFASISAALAAITDNSLFTPYIVQVGPGIYFEPPITLKPFVTVRGESLANTIIVCTNPIGRGVTGVDASGLVDISVTGTAGPGGVGIYYLGGGTGRPFLVQNCGVIDAETGVEVYGAAGAIAVLAVDTFVFNGVNTTVMKFHNDGATPVRVSISVSQTARFAPPQPSRLLDISGVGVFIVMANMSMECASNTLGGTTGVRVADGAILFLTGCLFKGMWNGVLNPTGGAGCDINIDACEFNNITYAVRVENPLSTGAITGDIDIRHMFVHPLSNFILGNLDPNTIVVGKKGVNINTISGAIQFINPTLLVNTVNLSPTITQAAGLFNVQMTGAVVSGAGIPPGTTATFVNETTMVLSLNATATATTSALFTTATSINKYILSIGPGIYVEPNPVYIPDYISLVGQSNVYIVASNPFVPVLQIGNFVTVRSLTVAGSAAPGGIGVLIDSTQGVYFAELTVAQCDIGIKMMATSAMAQMVISGLMFSDISSYGLWTDGRIVTGLNPVVLSTGTTITHVGSGSPQVCRFEGPFSNITLANTIVFGDGLCQGVVISDSAAVSMGNIGINTCSNALVVENVGGPPNIAVDGYLVQNSTGYDVLIQHPGTTGVLRSINQRTKTSIASGAPLSVQYQDPVTPSTTIAGGLYLGGDNTDACDSLQLITHIGLVSGAYVGGSITAGVGLAVNITAGSGYLEFQDAPHIIRKYTWGNTIMPLPASTTSYIYVDINGVLTNNPAKPAFDQSILLGRVRTAAAAVEFVDLQIMATEHIGNLYDQFHRNAIGAVVARGITTSVNASRQLAVSSGQYYYSGDEFNPSGGSAPLAFSTYYHVAGVFAFTTGVTVFDNAQYDDGVNLVAAPAGSFLKHSLYMLGQGVNEQYLMVYSQGNWVDAPTAQAAPYPAPPNYFTEGVIMIAGVIVQQGNAAYSLVVDKRPVITTNLSSIASTLVHGSLLGLLADDHPQYLLVNGTRAMTGGFNMGGFTITNALTVNGVTVEAHASRHLPNGADPLATAAPTVNISAVSTNTAGTQNSFARSDHTHAWPTATPVAIGFANSPGVASTGVRSDHVHEGVHSVRSDANPQRYNDIRFVSGVGVTITDDGANNFTFALGGTLVDNTTFIVDAVDPTKRLGFDVTGTASTTTTLQTSQTANRTVTLPDATDTLVGRSTTDTLANKSLVDASVLFTNTLDPTKRLGVSLGGATASTTTTLVASQTVNRSLTLPDATDTLVARNTGDILTNKTLTDSTNNVTSRAMWVATGAASVSTYASGVPSAGDVLTANSATTAVWTTPSYITTAANVNIGGVGVYKGQSGTTLQFKGVAAGSTKVSVTDDIVNNVVSVDVVPANISVNGLGSYPLTAANGGTGQTSYAVGDLLYASGATTLTRLADVATGNALISGGVATAPSWGKIGLTTHVSGVLPVANGGTNSSSALNNNRVMVSSGGAIVEAAGLTNGQLLIGSTGAAPVASTLTASTGISITNAPGSITIAAINNGTVTSVGLSMPGEFSVSNSPVTSTGTLTVTKANQSANTVYCGPASGGAAQPTFRALVTADLSTITPRTFSISSSNFSVNSGGGVTIGYFPWNNTVFSVFTTRTVTLWVVPSSAAGKDLTVNVVNNGGATIGTITINGGSAVGAIYTFTFTAPGADTRLDFTTSRTGGAGNNPQIYGVTLTIS